MTTVARDRSLPIALIVEAQRLFVPFLADVARRAGLEPMFSKSPALAAARGVRPDVVLLGVDVRSVRPFDVLRRTRRALPDAKIVVMTCRDDPGWNVVARALGADAVLGALADSRLLASVVRAT